MIRPLVERGLMPTFAAMTERGVWGNLASMQPMLSPMLWNSIATGKRPDQHGVLGFTEPNPSGAGVRTVASTSRRCKAIWNILTQCGLRSNVVGWYASHPAEPIRGVMVSNAFEQITPAPGGGLAPPPAGSVHPAPMTERLAPFRVRPAEIDATAVLPFIPDAERLRRRESARVGALRSLIAQSATIHATATHLLAETEWDFAAVYYEGIDRFAHEFMEFHPPRMDGVDPEDFEAYRGCMEGCYRFHDMMLQTLLDLAGEETAVMLISDHGYFSDHLRPDPTDPSVPPQAWHRPFGVFAARGPGVRAGARLFGATLLDITPTLLHLLGLPAGQDMPGRVLSEALAHAEPLDRVFSWEDIPGDAGMHPADLRVDPADAHESMRQLVALGYVEAPSDDEAQAASDAANWNRINLAHAFIDANRPKRAAETLEELSEPFASLPGVRLLQASCLIALGDRPEARAILAALLEDEPEHPRVHLMLGVLALSEGHHEEGLRRLETVSRLAPREPGLHTKLGAVYRNAGRHREALESYNTALRQDGDNPVAYLGRAQTHLAIGDAAQALEDAMIAAELVHHMPAAHDTIGRALLRLGRHEDAVRALRVCVGQAPTFARAHEALAEAYRALGREHEAIASETRGRQLRSRERDDAW